MGLFSSSGKKIGNVKFFFILLTISAALAIGAGFLLSDEEALAVGLIIAFFGSVFVTLFRILKNCNDPDNRLGNWKYFFTLFFFIAGLFCLLLFFISHDDEAIVMSIIAAFAISAVVTIWRSIKHWHQERKAEKERKQQYQDRLQRENRQYADQLAQKDRMIRDLQNRNSELQKSRQSSSSSSKYDSWREEEEERRQNERWEREQEQKWEREQERIKQERLEDWYREYVTIDVNFDFHYRDSEYNQDYWERRSDEIRVTRREAMALIQAGEGAIMGRLGYSNSGLIRNVSYQVPYRLYERPWNC